ncbi:MAG: OmpA family protein [Candidatus Omnitrophica bacterium]|nr:OmpA family protein [Candidatus Omnitrophota bacterium]
MKDKRAVLRGIAVLAVLCFTISGCAVNFYKQSPRSKKKIEELKARVDELEKLRADEQEKFAKAKSMLGKKLKQQIADEDVFLRMSDGSLVIVLSDNILFDSGKAELKERAFPVLGKVAEIIKREVPGKNIGVGGHTDNVPITFSNWKSNWELSSARATNVLYFFEDEGIPSEKLSATGYGEYRPIASNDTPGGREKNRRVEIIILPEFVEKRSSDKSGHQAK